METYHEYDNAPVADWSGWFEDAQGSITAWLGADGVRVDDREIVY